MTAKEELPAVSMANTKKELLEAYEAAKKRHHHLNKDLLDAQQARKRLEKHVATATADAQAEQDPVKRLHDLRGAISRELGDLAERFETEIETYRKIQSAIEVKQTELDTLYDVETAASDLAALIDAQQMKKEQFEQEMASRKTELETRMQETRDQWQREKVEYDRQATEQREAADKQRQREKEEYDYGFAREKEQRKNHLEDELQALEKEIAAKQSSFEGETRQRTDTLDDREESIAGREKEIAALQKEVESFPERSEASVQTAIAETTERLTNNSERDRALVEARFEGQKNVLVGKIDALEKMVASQAVQIADLSQKSEQAYEKVQDIATRAVTASRRGYPSPVPQSTGPVRDDSQS